MFGHPSKPTRIYSYDCKEPSNLEVIDNQIFLAHVYRNRLVEEELKRRGKVDAAQLDMFPDLAALKQRAEQLSELYIALQQEIKSERQKTRTRSEKKELRDRAVQTGKERKEAWKSFSESRKKSWEDARLREISNAIIEESHAERKRLRAAIVVEGLWWCNYLTSEAGVTNSGRPPVFHRYHKDGKVRVQIHKGLAPEQIFSGADNRLRISPMLADSWEPGTPARFRRTSFWLRIHSNQDRSPVWTTAEFTMHRPLPADSRVKDVYLLRRHVGPKTVWKIQFVVSRDAWEEKATGTGSVGVDVGWRLLLDQPDPAENGLRIAAWEGSDGAKGKVIIPPAKLAYWDKAEDLQSIRDKIFNEALAEMIAWLRDNQHPEWLQEATAEAAMWKGKHRLLDLVRGGVRFVSGMKTTIPGWKDQRFDGDERIFSALEAWGKQERHLHEWQGCNIAKITAWRQQFYHEAVALLRRTYSKAGVEATNWREIIQNPRPEEDAKKLAGKYNRIAAVGGFIDIVGESMAVTRVDPAHTTKRCRQCGKVCQFDAARSLRHTCEHCSAEWDQDENAAGNILDGMTTE